MKICIHMKSGKTLTQSGVKEYSFKYNGNEIKNVTLELKWWAPRTILVGTIDMSNIEAVTQH